MTKRTEDRDLIKRAALERVGARVGSDGGQLVCDDTAGARPIWTNLRLPRRNLLTIVVVTNNVRHVPNVVAQKLKQRTPFSTPEQEILLGLRIAAARVVEPWAKFLKATAQLSTNQYNVLRILRGSHPTKLACGDISERMIERDPDITRLVDRLAKRRLVTRARSRQDRRIVEVGITEQGLALLRELDAHVQRLPTALLGHLGPERGRQLAALLEAVIAGIGPFP